MTISLEEQGYSTNRQRAYWLAPVFQERKRKGDETMITKPLTPESKADLEKMVAESDDDKIKEGLKAILSAYDLLDKNRDLYEKILAGKDPMWERIAEIEGWKKNHEE